MALEIILSLNGIFLVLALIILVLISRRNGSKKENKQVQEDLERIKEHISSDDKTKLL
jgi:preprotein translocase subunit SecG